jgi:FAD-dependent halogenase
MNNTENVDVLVVGGGPAGATAATFMAMKGHRVLLVEKETLPLYKIGESLLPSTIHGICAMLGVSREIKNANFVRKLGGTFRWGKNKDPWTFSFSESSRFPGPTGYAYQVERMKFDSILLNNARRKGVEVRERHSVAELAIEGGSVTGAELVGAGGEPYRVNAKYVVDASGHSSNIAHYAGTRVYSKFFRNLAVFGYFRNGKRLPPPRSGNIFCAAFDKGWFWYIPLTPDLTSVGAVIGQEHAALLRSDHADALRQLIADCEPIRSLLADSTRVDEGPYGEVRVRKDFSYCHTKFWRPGLVLVGDAACFIDPVFSSGVHLATYSALLAARSINSYLSGKVSEERAFTEFEKRYLREYKYFHDFLMAFYDLDQDLDAYYWAARKTLNSAEGGNEAFIRLVGGLAGSGESLYGGEEAVGAVQGKFLFPAAESGTNMSTENSSIERKKFMAALTSEGVQLQVHASMGGGNSDSRPLFPSGLIPSLDGLQWDEPN